MMGTKVSSCGDSIPGHTWEKPGQVEKHLLGVKLDFLHSEDSQIKNFSLKKNLLSKLAILALK
jgi:hypothetical protein